MAGIGVILNRNAGRGRSFRGRTGEKMAFILGDPSSLRETGEIAEIDGVARLFAEREIEILGIGGGDGSNHYVLSALIQVYGERPLPKVLFLRGGTHNVNAASIGLRGTPEAILDRLMRRYHAKESIATTVRPILRIDDGTRIHHGFSIATGFLYRFFEEMHVGRRDRPWKVAALIASLFGSFFARSGKIDELFRLQAARITLSGELLPWDRQNGIAASTMEQVGLGFRPFSRANETPQTFHALVFRLTPGRFARVSRALARGRLRNHAQHLSAVSKSLVLDADEPIPYVLDGDLFRGGNRLEIRTGPKLQLLLV